MDPNTLATQISQLDQSYNPVDTYNKITTQLGIPDARTRVTALQTQLQNSENAIKAVDPSVTGRTQNSLVTEAQRQRLVNMEKAPLTETYNEQGKQYGTEQTNLGNLQTEADRQAGLAESGYKTKRQSLADQLDFSLKQQARQDSLKQAAASSSGGASRSGGGGGGGNGGGSAAASPGSQQRKDGGFNFQDASGNTISARRYAQLTGTNFNTLLKKMAGSGDKGAADVLKNGGSSKTYKALTWN